MDAVKCRGNILDARKEPQEETQGLSRCIWSRCGTATQFVPLLLPREAGIRVSVQDGVLYEME